MANRAGYRKPTPESILCPDCKGLLADTTSRLAEALGILHRECANCHHRWAFKMKESESFTSTSASASSS